MDVLADPHQACEENSANWWRLVHLAWMADRLERTCSRNVWLDVSPWQANRVIRQRPATPKSKAIPFSSRVKAEYRHREYIGDFLSQQTKTYLKALAQRELQNFRPVRDSGTRCVQCKVPFMPNPEKRSDTCGLCKVKGNKAINGYVSYLMAAEKTNQMHEPGWAKAIDKYLTPDNS